MEKKYWTEKWQSGDIKFNQAIPHPVLDKYFPKTTKETVLVPLCGKSIDLIWLMNRGHHVIGIEWSPIACEDFFEENKISFEKTSQGSFTVFRADRVELWCGDFFEFSESAAKSVTAIYDRAALVALPENLRRLYAEHLLKILQIRAISIFLLVSFEYPQDKIEGPPFSVAEKEIRSLFSPTFQLKLIEKNSESGLEKNPKFLGVGSVLESVYILDAFRIR